jgi:hypothetical protein
MNDMNIHAEKRNIMTATINPRGRHMRKAMQKQAGSLQFCPEAG